MFQLLLESRLVLSKESMKFHWSDLRMASTMGLKSDTLTA